MTASQLITGTGDYRYEVHDQWPQLPREFTWQTTHDACFDKDGNIIVAEWVQSGRVTKLRRV
jgi:hypothetical protein